MFYTRFTHPKQKASLLDQVDNVDRLSYVDSTKLVQRFISEGKNLQLARARALSSGLYSPGENLDTDNDPFLPVYVPDPVDRQQILDNYMAKKRARDERVRDDLAKSTAVNNAVSETENASPKQDA